MTSAALALVLLLPALGSGCGPATHEVDQAALYTPESLAQELAFRYRALSPAAQKAPTRSRSRAKPAKSLAQLDAAEKLEKKAKDVTTAKQARIQSLDGLLDDIEGKLDRIKGTSRADACRKMAETIVKEGSLTESDKKLLSEKLKELGESS
jgi:hypothetical protein